MISRARFALGIIFEAVAGAVRYGDDTPPRDTNQPQMRRGADLRAVLSITIDGSGAQRC